MKTALDFLGIRFNVASGVRRWLVAPIYSRSELLQGRNKLRKKGENSRFLSTQALAGASEAQH
jgi:hypothetical protein